MSSVAVLILVLSTIRISAQHVCYVKPDVSPPQACPGQPCLTLDQYTQQAETYFTTGATFLFLAGNHSLLTVIHLTNCSDITLRKGNYSDDSRIVYRNEALLLLENVNNLTIEGLTFILFFNSLPSALEVINCKQILISDSIFKGSGTLEETRKRALYCKFSIVTVARCYFEGNTGDCGGAVYATDSNITFTDNTFANNKAELYGGTIYAAYCDILLNGNFMKLINNTAEKSGGGINVQLSNLTASSTHLYFINNSAESGGAVYIDPFDFEYRQHDVYVQFVLLRGHFINNRADCGGAVWVEMDEYMEGEITFVNITATGNSGTAFHISDSKVTFCGIITIVNNNGKFGGGIYIYRSTLTFCGSEYSDSKLINNRAEKGGGIYIEQSNFIIANAYFINNTADYGGAIYISNHHKRLQIMLSGHFVDNRAGYEGGAVWIYGQANDHHITLTDITVTGNSGSALYILNSKVNFNGIARIMNNTGEFGGGMYAKNSILSFSSFKFGYNTADLGGAMYFLYCMANFQGNPEDIAQIAVFTHNTAHRNGGAFYATGTNITIKNEVRFISNSAQNGGAMYLNSGVTMIFATHISKILTSRNYASECGGAIYHNDAPTPFQCNLSIKLKPHDLDMTVNFEIPYCFTKYLFTLENAFVSNFDSAERKGDFMYGGLMDRCRIMNILGEDYLPYEKIKLSSFGMTITSEPYQLCFCENSQEYDCYKVKHLITHRGQTLKISLVALDMLRTVIPTHVTAIINPGARLKLNQSFQYLRQNCSLVTYNLYSTESQEQLTLYPDGPCHDTGHARAIVSVTLLPCPDGFTQSGEQCVCEKRLQMHDVDCRIEESIHIIRQAGSRFWMSGLYDNGSYQGLVLFKTCPLQYCKNAAANITLDDPDTQCAHNRGGVLCGQCNANYSLMLGSDQCQMCSNTYLALLLPFAAAGVVLVVFLTFLRLTVATGMINSLILYANIVQANKNLFISNSARNILTVFIAWMNLDLGFNTCFYDGMDAYAQTWLQFAFPAYVWILISLIIVTSRYSITVSKLIGSNPIAVMATLLLMSYAKVLRITIEVYSSVDLDTPGNMSVSTVWLKDANAPYLRSKHLLLTVVTSLVLVFLFLPYTLLLLLGHKLYHFTGRKGLRWFNKMKPLLDSYHAPYKTNTRYWTGFLLLVRCALYIVFSYNSLGATTKSLLAINITFTGITIISGYLASGKIYSNFYTNLIEVFTYFNLIMLSAAALAGANSPALVYTLIGIVFITTIGIFVYHFHLLYIAKSAIWMKLNVKLNSFIDTVRNPTTKQNVEHAPVETSPPVPHKIVSKTIIELREPLLDD